MIGETAGRGASDRWEAIDATTAAGDHHTVLLETKEVRVLDTRIAVQASSTS